MRLMIFEKPFISMLFVIPLLGKSCDFLRKGRNVPESGAVAKWDLFDGVTDRFADGPPAFGGVRQFF